MTQNEQVIARCRKMLASEEEPHVSTWVDVLENLCNRLEKAEAEIKVLTDERNVALGERDELAEGEEQRDLDQAKAYR